jgi:hypothetical protein
MPQEEIIAQADRLETTARAVEWLGEQRKSDREQVEQALHSIRPAVRACVEHGDTRTAVITITFASSGRVTTANTEAPFAGSPAGSCMARAARQARVPAFERATLRVRAPFEP